MGVDVKKAPPLPAPTESESLTPTDQGTEVSKAADDKSSYSLPDDGTPVTIKTRGHKPNRSQTSLLIEYFEGGRSPSPSNVSSSANRRPSVRVRLTPSKGRSKNDHIQITETRSMRGSTVSKRVAATRSDLESSELEETKSVNSYTSATEESNVSRNPIEVEITPSERRRRDRKVSSPLIPASDSKVSSYVAPNGSDISAIPSDSFLDGDGKDSSSYREGKRVKSPSQGSETLAAGALGAVASAVAADKLSRKPRSGTQDQKIIERAVERASKPERRRRTSKARTSDVSEKDSEVKSSARRRSRAHKESVVSGADSSVLSSQLSPSHRSYDSHSSSKVSINNPKLLETVEDAIRRLILPELNAIKRETSKREARSRDRERDRESLSSVASASKEDISVASKRKSADTTQSTKSRGREARNDLSPRSSIDEDSLAESIQGDGGIPAQTPRQSEDRLVDPALLGAASAVGAAMTSQDRVRADDRRQRRRRRAKTPERARASGDLDRDHEITPPMPLSSEINPSDLTRTSIRSPDTDRPHSASEEMKPLQEVSRGVAAMETAGSETPTPTRTPVQSMQTLGSLHANVSHGDLKALPRQGPGSYEREVTDSDLSPRFQDEYDEDYDEAGQYAEPGMYEAAMDPGFYGSQDVPPPLRYVPYQQERRGLSPIESVSGYTESSVQHRRDSRVSQDQSATGESPSQERDVPSPSSVPSNLRSRGFDDEESDVHSAGGHYRDTRYTDDSELDRVTSGQAVRDLGANPEIVHPTKPAESAVASLVDGSALTPSQLSAGQDYHDSQISYKDDMSDKGSGDARQTATEEHEQLATPVEEAHSDVSEYDLDEYGRKVPRSQYRQSPTASEQATINAALGRAVALKAKNNGQPSSGPHIAEETVQGEGVSRNRSFKERAKSGYQIDSTPKHSVDRLSDYEQPKMGVSGLPDADHPMPEIGYGLGEEQTPSIVQEPLGGPEHGSRGDWSGERTPTQERSFDFEPTTPQAKKPEARGLGISTAEAAAAGALATAGIMAASHSRHASGEQDGEWQRTSDDRKRDTLVTNPYEGASPIANLPGVDSNILGDAYRAGFNNGSPGLVQGGDEGYISAAPNDANLAKGKGVDFAGQRPEDPFYSIHNATRHLSGLSNGLGSPLYDAATGTGIDRIQSKDIIALMEHLMVRDAQRSARDTELLVTLVRSAAEMRNSFNDIKRLLIDSEEQIIGEVKDNTEKTVQRHINGPRPYPGSVGTRSVQGTSAAGTIDSLPTKKRNLFRRALKGLGAKGTNDLSRIEEMLMQLLGEVETLKHQTAAPGADMTMENHSSDNIRPEVPYEQDRGYEPEGNAGTSTASHASQSGHLSIPQPRGSAVNKSGYERKFSDHRIDTVPEDNEDDYHNPPGTTHNQFSNPDSFMSPALPPSRGEAAPLDTPPQTQGPDAMLSNENTPLTDASKKHKSKGSSGFFPKISRWSETTTSSFGKVFRNSRNKQDNEEFQPSSSRSGSDLNENDYYAQTDPTGDDKLHSGFSEQDLPGNTMQPMSDVVESPTQPQSQPQTRTIPMRAYSTPEDPKYKAHRNSLNLQHPQPRQGQTERFRSALETSAQVYDSPMSPHSADWAGSTSSLNRYPAQTTNRYEDDILPGEYTFQPTSSAQGPPRPPKEPLDLPDAPSGVGQVGNPQRHAPSPLPYENDEEGYRAAVTRGSPRYENKNLSAALGVPTRRPSGPRAMTPTQRSRGSPASPRDDDIASPARDERRRKRDTFGTIASQQSQESETF